MSDLNHAHAVIALDLSAVSGDGKSWIEVAPTADKVRNGPFFFTITREDLETYAESIRANAGKLPVDYDHDGAKPDGSSRAAGWFTGQAEVRDTADGPRLFAEVQWTPRAVEEIRGGEFRFVSGEFSFAERDKKTGLMTRAKNWIAATLTNRPFFKELAPVTAAVLIDSDQLDQIGAEYGDTISKLVLAAAKAEDKDVRAALDAVLADNPKRKETPMSDFKTIAKELGLDETADEAAVVAALKERSTKQAELEKELENVKTSAVPDDQVKKLIASAAKGEEAAAELADMKITTMLDDAVREFKILPAQRDGYAAMAKHDFDGVKVILDATPADALKLEVKGSGGSGPVTDDPDAEVHAAEFQPRGDTAGDPIDEDSLKLHAKAMKVLAEKGKETDYTAEEYMSALTSASKA